MAAEEDVETQVLSGRQTLSHTWASGPPVGSVIAGRYELKAIVGQGGMAVVYRATDLENGELRAVKVMLPTRESLVERMAAEAATLALLRHPNLVAVFDMGSEGGGSIHYAVMEYAPLGSLQGRGALVPVGDRCAQVAAIGLHICCGLSVLHERGIIHRDIKPSNILLAADGRPMIADLGISRIPASSMDRTQEHLVMGSLPYMAPEQRMGLDGTTPQSDVYGVGATLFNLCTGKSPMDLFLAAQGARWQGVPESLRPILQWATRREARERPKDVLMLGKALLPLTPSTILEAYPHLDRWLNESR